MGRPVLGRPHRVLLSYTFSGVEEMEEAEGKVGEVGTLSVTFQKCIVISI